MDKQEHNTKDAMWLLVLGWLLGQFVLLLIILNRVLRRESERTIPETREPQAAAMPTTTAQTSQREAREGEFWAGRLAPYWDVIGLTSVAITIVGAATFYIAGWFYEAHWYSYYGIEVSQIELVPHQVMVQGVPGILLLVFSASLSLALFLIGRLFFWIISWLKKGERLDLAWNMLVSAQNVIRVERKDVLLTVIRAYFWVIILVLIATLGLAGIGVRETLWDVLIIVMPGFIILTIAQVVATLDVQMRTCSAVLTGEYSKIPLNLFALALALPTSVLSLIVRRVFARRFRVRDAISGLDEERQELLLDFLKQLGFQEDSSYDAIYIVGKLFEFYSRMYGKLVDIALASPAQFWLGLILLMFFLVSIAASSLLGEFDACRGARSLSGDWHLPRIFLFSERPVRMLREHEREYKEPGFVYGPLALLTSNESTWFLVDWKESQYFERRPALYVVPRGDNQGLHIFQPTPAAPTTPKASPEPRSTLTPTRTVSAEGW